MLPNGEGAPNPNGFGKKKQEVEDGQTGAHARQRVRKEKKKIVRKTGIRERASARHCWGVARLVAHYFFLFIFFADLHLKIGNSLCIVQTTESIHLHTQL